MHNSKNIRTGSPTTGDNDGVSEADQPVGVPLSALDPKQLERDTPLDPDPSVRRWTASKRAAAMSAPGHRGDCRLAVVTGTVQPLPLTT
jgi:hypothetical protein